MIVLLAANGISFAIQCVLFLLLGSLADYGSWRPYILIFWSIVGFGVGFGWLGVYRPDQWPTGVALYMLGSVLESRLIQHPWKLSTDQRLRYTQVDFIPAHDHILDCFFPWTGS